MLEKSFFSEITPLISHSKSVNKLIPKMNLPRNSDSDLNLICYPNVSLGRDSIESNRFTTESFVAFYDDVRFLPDLQKSLQKTFPTTN